MSNFIQEFNNKAIAVHHTAVEKGWWDSQRNEGELLCLIHAEVSEALEGLRSGNPPDDKIPQFNAVETELADVIIRIMDYAQAMDYRVAEALEAKTSFNKTRPYKHGKKF